MLYVCSDIHGEYDLFVKLLQKIKFSPTDEMIICGDIIDKGRDSVKLLKLVKSTPNIRFIIGNHEYAFLKYYWAIMKDSPSDFNQVLKDLQSYFEYDGMLLDWDTIDWLESLPYYVEDKDFLCVHAGVSLDTDNNLVPLEQTAREQLVYDRKFKDPSVVPSVNKCIFFGHTPTCYICNQSKIIKYKRDNGLSNTIRDYYKIHLDLGVWLYGILGCLCVDTLEEFYVEK